MQPLVSVCITSYNYGRYIRDAIECALTQTYPNIEVVVSDNGSTDTTHEVLATYADDPRVRVFVNESNVGLCRNHNLAIKRSRGEYIVMLSADDLLFPEHISVLMHRIQDPLDPVLVATGQGMQLSEDLQPLSPLLTLGNIPLAYSRRDNFGSLFLNYHHVYPARLIARSVYDQVGLFDESIITSIDIEMCARIEEADIPSAFVPSFVCGLRSHGSRRSVRSRSRMNEFLNDKLCMAERALQPKNAWRIEGYEAGVLAIFEMEQQLLAQKDPEPLNAEQSARLDRVRATLLEYQQQIPEWPAHEPQLSVVIMSEGYLQLLRLTLDALAAQSVERVEIVVIQTSGCDVRPWIARLPHAASVRVIQARACATPAEAFRYGMDLARGEFVTYLCEGQLIGTDVYSTIIDYARSTKAQMFVLPKESVCDDALLEIERESRYHQFADPATRARQRAEGGPYALCQLTHRRALLRCAQLVGTSYYDMMIGCDESVFVQVLSGVFQTVAFESYVAA